MARFDKTRKLERNAQLIQYIKDHPELSMNEVGEVFHISRTRIYQLRNRIAKQGR
jgi:DNA-directed RNA polymerase specialized sigma subunit